MPPGQGTGTVAASSDHASADRGATRSWYFVGRDADMASLRRIVAWETRRAGADDDVVDSTVLAADELATNALAFGPFELRLYTDPLGWAVADACPAGTSDVAAHLTGDQTIPSLDEDGRGLLIVGTLFPDFQVRPTTVPPDRSGKEVRFWVTGQVSPTGSAVAGRVLHGRGRR